jgi:hypothetical protein
MTRLEAETLLRQFICTDPTTIELDYAKIREALLLVVELSDYQILGVCADTAIEGIRSLQSYLDALSYDFASDIRSLDGVIYIKYNPKTGRAHMEPYIGEHRGVLVSCQSAYDHDVNETFGHLPLDLFDKK